MVGCPKDDEPVTEVLRNPQEVYNEDIAEIEDFMDTHFTTVDTDYNVTFTKITTSTPGTPISDGLDTSTNQDDSTKPLKHKSVTVAGVSHKIYFLKLREGTGNTAIDLEENDRPTKLDSVFTSYKGQKLDLSVFDAASNPVWFQLQHVITGWQQIFSEFKRGNSTFNSSTGSTTYTDFGAGVMFVPSGLAYYNTGSTATGTYAPLIFSFKLMNINYVDNDGDLILSKDEYLGTGLVSDTARDSDSDGKPDYADFDDDNDGVLTKNEYKDKTVILTSTSTPVSIPKSNGTYIYNQLPDCSGNQFVLPSKPKHLNSSCQ